jgi:hypothetical protein
MSKGFWGNIHTKRKRIVEGSGGKDEWAWD